LWLDGGPDPILLGEVFNNPPPPESEDCLTLNVFAPALDTEGEDQRPVLVFIHGGGFQMGSARTATLESFAAYENIVAVSIEYRTNGTFRHLDLQQNRLLFFRIF
jgi:acetylcholinesterase